MGYSFSAESILTLFEKLLEITKKICNSYFHLHAVKHLAGTEPYFLRTQKNVWNLKRIIETKSSIPAKKYFKNCNYSVIFLSCYYEFCAGGAGWDTHLSRLSAFFPQSRETDLHRQALSHSHLMSALRVFS